MLSDIVTLVYCHIPVQSNMYQVDVVHYDLYSAHQCHATTYFWLEAPVPREVIVEFHATTAYYKLDLENVSNSVQWVYVFAFCSWVTHCNCGDPWWRRERMDHCRRSTHGHLPQQEHDERSKVDGCRRRIPLARGEMSDPRRCKELGPGCNSGKDWNGSCTLQKFLDVFFGSMCFHRGASRRSQWLSWLPTAWSLATSWHHAEEYTCIYIIYMYVGSGGPVWVSWA